MSSDLGPDCQKFVDGHESCLSGGGAAGAQGGEGDPGNYSDRLSVQKALSIFSLTVYAVKRYQ